MHVFLLKRSLLLILFSLVHSLIWSQQENDLKISGHYSGISLIAALRQIETDYPVKFYYKEEWFARDTLDISFDDKDLGDAVKTMLNGRPYTFKIIHGSQVVILPRDEVAMLVGAMLNYSDNGDLDKAFIQVGDLEEAGRQKTVALTGKIVDGKTGDPIIGAVVQVNNLQQGVVSGLDGRYKLTLSPGLYTLAVSSVGYEKNEYHVKLVGDGDLNLELFDKSIALEDIVIYGQRLDRNVSSHQMSLVELDVKSIKQLPSISGSKDVLKGLTTMPGVKSIGEFSSGINVRGGGEDQNLYLFNGAPLFNTSHVLGLVSVINPDAVDKLFLYKGHIPAIYGERVSSVIDIRTNETPPERFSLKGGIGLYDSKLMVMVPVVKDKVFFELGGRTYYSNWILKNSNDNDLRNSLASFYDLNGTLHVQMAKSRLTFSGYTCYDEFRFASEVKYSYGSNLGSVTWNYMLGSNLSSTFSLSYSSYDVAKDDISKNNMQSRIESGIQHTALKYRIKYSGIQKHNIDIGLGVVDYQIDPGRQTPLNEMSLVTTASLPAVQGYEGAVFINDEYTLNEYITLNAGLRVSGYRSEGQEDYYGWEPRLSSKIQLNDVSSFKMSYNRNIQYLSLVSASSVATPSDIWVLAHDEIRPLIANQFAVGYYRNFSNNSIETSVEIYYKGLTNIIEYMNGAQLEMNPDMESLLLNAEGRNYGIETMLKKNTGKFDGWITYTYSRSLRKTSGVLPEEKISNNQYFPSSYDKPHDFTTVLNYHLNKRITFGANFTYSTGRPITLPEHKYGAGDETAVVFSDKNEYRIPDYHRLDISLTVDESLKLTKKWKGSWSFSLLNVYGRKNAYTIFYKKEEPNVSNGYNRYALYKLYLIGRPVPAITYSFIF